MAVQALKHKSKFITPIMDGIPDQELRQVMTDLCRQLADMFSNVYDDEQVLRIAEVYGAALPTAASQYRGRFFLKTNTSAEDTLHICVSDGVGGYAWKQVTLS